MRRPITTLFMLMSVDGKISTGSTDDLDFDRDLPKVPGVAEGLHQYYELEQDTDLWSLNTGRVMAKTGVNELEASVKLPVSFAILDNTHLKRAGVEHLCAKVANLVIITSNLSHPAFGVDASNLSIVFQKSASLADALACLKQDFGCNRLTIQSGATLNAELIRQGLIDYLDIVVAPVVVGGVDTPSLVGGWSFRSVDELADICVLELVDCVALSDSYIRLRYCVRT